ncbi:MAG: DUF2628 domain-containing protein [Beijerinckiaceae bacterium]
MASYTVHIPLEATTLEAVAEKSVFVKDGFSFPGFLFTGLWLLANRLWLHALGYAAVLGLVAGGFWLLSLPFAAFGPIQLLLALLIGLEGPEWLRRRYTRKGWTHAGAVSGPSLDECERRFFEGWLANAGQPPVRPPAAPMASAAPSGPAVLGLFPSPRAPG